MRIAMRVFRRGIIVHHGKIRARLTSVRSILHYLCFQIYDRGITLTPSYIRKDEVFNYLVDTYGIDQLKPLRSYSNGVYQLDDYLMLEFASKVVKDKDLSSDLDILSSYFRVKETEKNLSLYLGRRQSIKGKNKLKPYATIEYGRIVFKAYNDVSYHDNFYTLGNAKELYVSDIFYNALAKYAGLDSDSTWTFCEELTREEESRYIIQILDGKIKPTTDKGKKVYDAYLKTLTSKTPNTIFQETLLERAEAIDELTKWVIDNGYQLRGVTDYSIIYENGVDSIKDVPIYASYYAWDYDYNMPLDSVNRLRGVGGEFTRQVTDNNQETYPYEVIVDGKIERMYRVEIEDPIIDTNYEINSKQEEYEDELGLEGELTKDQDSYPFEYRIQAEHLRPDGFLYTGDDDFVRALNSADLELNGGSVKVDTDIFPNLSLSKQRRSADEYDRLRQGGEEMEFKVKTIIDSEDTMYIRQHLKYYDKSQRGERVVEGMIMLDESLQVVDLQTHLSDEIFLPLDRSDLSKQRLGVYAKDTDIVYAYKFLAMYDVETGRIERVKDTVLGMVRRGKSLYARHMTMMGLDGVQEEAITKVARRSVLDKVVKHNSRNGFFKGLRDATNEGVKTTQIGEGNNGLEYHENVYMQEV